MAVRLEHSPCVSKVVGFEPRLDLFISAGGVMPTVIPIMEREAAVYTRIVRQWGGAYYKYSLTAHMSRQF